MEPNWQSVPSQISDERSYWCPNPNNPQVRWHVGYHFARMIGSVPGQVLEADGWYWHTADWTGNQFSSMFGPFSSEAAAMADCEAAHRIVR